MSRRLNPCRRCGDQPEGPTKEHRFTLRRGLTRHDDRLCSACRQGRPTHAEIVATIRRFRGRAA
ncbi:hypothetical protein [Auraticoccus monumenti]|uniref:Uncharacterized protein n=1 Tax=Auraticoccus monumenti TaxID=675864 RepID=A0A1G6UNX9_9ACTN|nr:hypothetical protein [Auraticoccus monumenti]SDD42255.1 hypothetical protein SAMN04489747_0916 [Auraticoccus monumenti]